jgi:hypothetical protein
MVIDWGDGKYQRIHKQRPNNTIGGNNVRIPMQVAGTYQIKISPRLVVGGDGLHRDSF